MLSIRNIFKIGIGPSSSHTMGPSFAAERFFAEYGTADFIKVILYGSLAKTGKGHGTDRAIAEMLTGIETEIVWDTEAPTDEHPNTLDFIAFKNGKELGRKRFYSIGGGEVRTDDDRISPPKKLYNEKTFSEISELCKSRNIRLSDYVFEHEGEGIKEFLYSVWQTKIGRAHV